MNSVLVGLPPRIRDDCRVLVLGSMPGEASLDAARYYAHARNRFWPVMARLCGFDATLEYEARIAALQDAGVGVWDVIGQCERRGSLDASIVRGSEIANPIIARVQTCPNLRAIAFNGATAARAFARHVAPGMPSGPGAPTLHALPSTSPANASFDADRLHAQWHVLAPYLRP